MMRLNTENPGLTALFLPYKAALIQRLYEATRAHTSGRGQTTSELTDWFNEYADDTGMTKMSRASIINALKELAREGILEYTEETCKGGHRRLYSVAMTPEEFMGFVISAIHEKLASMFSGVWWRIGQ